MSDGKELVTQEAGTLSPLDEGKRRADLQAELATYWATRLMDIVEKCNMRAIIGDKKYLEVEGWQLIGEFAQVRAVIDWTKEWIKNDELVGYLARCKIMNDLGEEVGSGESSCGFDAFPCRGKEGSEKDKAARSAAQTWSISRAYRNKFGFVAKLGGYEAVPAEEMIGGDVEKKLPACPKCGKQKSVIEGKPEFGGGFVCWAKREGCGHKWGQEEKAGNGKPNGEKKGLYELTATHKLLQGYLEDHCGGDPKVIGDMLEELTAWQDAKNVQHPGRREIHNISEKQAEYAVEKFEKVFGKVGNLIRS